VAAITGLPTNYTVHWKAPSTADTSCANSNGMPCPWPEITHSCTAADMSFADPAVRVAQLVGEFGANGLALSICDPSFAPALMHIGNLINAALTPPCITQMVQQANGEYICNVVSHTTNSTGTGFIDSTVPACSANGGAAPCWRLRAP